MTVKIYEADVLVVGSGLSGSLAGIRCKDEGLSVIIANKGSMCWSGASAACGGNDVNVCFPGDDPKDWMNAYVEHSEYTADQEWVKIFQDESYSVMTYLDELGEKHNLEIFPKKEGEYWRVRRYVNDNDTVLFNLFAALETFDKEIQQSDIKALERVSIIKLLTNKDGIYGAIGFDNRDGTPIIIYTKAVILAAGCCTYTVDMFDVCGEGMKMAFDVGAKMMGYDRGGAIVRPRHVIRGGALCNSTISSTGFAMGGRLLNGLGEDFVKNMSPEQIAMGRKGIDMAIAEEIKAGRGPIYEDYTHLDEDMKVLLKSMRKATWKRVKVEFGKDLFEEMIPIAEGVEQTITPDISNRMGGIWVDHQGQSSIKGLYSIGDNTWPAMSFQHPYNGSDLGWALLSGGRVHRFVKENIPHTNATNEGENSRKEDAAIALAELATFQGPKEDGISPEELRDKMVKCMIPYGEIHKSDASLQAAFDKVEDLEKTYVPRLQADNAHDLRKAFEVVSMITVAKLILKSEFFRKESRCGVRKEEYPQMDNVNWLKWIYAFKQGDEIAIGAEDIPTPYYEVPRTIGKPLLHRI